MGMAASQARYLALVARKSNCEYEGQQINQARTALSNQSANLFNQMLGLEVPVPPSTQDFTTTQYSYSDGINSSTISSWQQLSNADPDYNYVVTHYYYADRYTGSMKKLSDPQVQFASGIPADGRTIKAALDKMTEKYNAFETAKNARLEKEKEAATISNYAYSPAKYSQLKDCTYDSTANTFTIGKIDSTDTYVFKGYSSLDPTEKASVDAALDSLIEEGAIKEDFDRNKVYYCDGDIAFEDDLEEISGGPSGGSKTTLPAYKASSVPTTAAAYDLEIATLKTAEETALDEYNQSVDEYEALSRPTYVGNCELTPLASLDEDQQAEINQIVADMKDQGIDASISKCFDSEGNYTGGIYSFKLNGVTYYTTYDDLEESYASGTGNNNIDGQAKLTYYNATYVSTKVEETEKALLETDGNGRFTSVRFEDDTVTYALNMEKVTDDVAYKDAMNQYYYDNAVYDKTVQDINAKTSLIQQEDQQLELRLKQLDTEQNALSTEMEAVKKVVDDNVESTFKTFGG